MDSSVLTNPLKVGDQNVKLVRITPKEETLIIGTNDQKIRC